MADVEAVARTLARDAVEAAYEGLGRTPAGVLIDVVELARARRAAELVDERVAHGEVLPLAGRTFAVKGNIDLAGHRTTAACPGFGEIATRSAPVVRALEHAGAVAVAITNLDQFATGLVGTRSPYGACPNPGWPELVSGGSSSGSAAIVALGVVDFALGTDTAGSGRIPAAANGIVGVKPTRGRLPTAGVVPACRSLDCVSTFAGDVRLAALAADVAAHHDPANPLSRRPPAAVAVARGPLRLGIPAPGSLTFGGDPLGPARFARGVEVAIAATDAVPVEVDIEPLLAAGALLYGGAFVAERYEAVGAFVEAHPDLVDPIVGSIILAAGQISAWELVRDQHSVGMIMRATAATWAGVDAIALPTAPRIPTVAEVAAEPLLRNSELGTYASFVNLLDLCAVTVPTEAPGPTRPPMSLTLVAPAWSDDVLVTVAGQIEQGARATRRAP